MNNRPYKPGNWWWEDNDGDYFVAYFNNNMYYRVGTGGLYSDYLSVEQFEDEFDFKKWLGKAVPPRSRNEK